MEQGHFQDTAYSRHRGCRQGQGEGEREELFAQEPVNIPLLPVCAEVSVRAAPRRPGEAVPCEDAPVHFWMPLDHFCTGTAPPPRVPAGNCVKSRWFARSKRVQLTGREPHPTDEIAAGESKW